MSVNTYTLGPCPVCQHVVSSDIMKGFVARCGRRVLEPRPEGCPANLIDTDGEPWSIVHFELGLKAFHSRDPAAEAIGHTAEKDVLPIIHFVGFRGDEYSSAVKVWGEPHFIHPTWDYQAIGHIDEKDLVIFARGTADETPKSYR